MPSSAAPSRAPSVAPKAPNISSKAPSVAQSRAQSTVSRLPINTMLPPSPPLSPKSLPTKLPEPPIVPNINIVPPSPSTTQELKIPAHPPKPPRSIAPSDSISCVDAPRPAPSRAYTPSIVSAATSRHPSRSHASSSKPPPVPSWVGKGVDVVDARHPESEISFATRISNLKPSSTATPSRSVASKAPTVKATKKAATPSPRSEIARRPPLARPHLPPAARSPLFHSTLAHPAPFYRPVRCAFPPPPAPPPIPQLRPLPMICDGPACYHHDHLRHPAHVDHYDEGRREPVEQRGKLVEVEESQTQYDARGNVRERRERRETYLGP